MEGSGHARFGMTLSGRRAGKQGPADVTDQITFWGFVYFSSTSALGAVLELIPVLLDDLPLRFCIEPRPHSVVIRQEVC